MHPRQIPESGDGLALAWAPSLVRGLPPVFDDDARVLILGSFPGAASLRARHYYAHPRNQFWAILSVVLGRPLLDLEFEDRYRSLRSAGIALWDVVDQCIRPGSLDADIREAMDTGMLELVERLPRLRAVFFNGRYAARRARLFDGRPLHLSALPSTSPAHAGLSFQAKLDAWCRAFRSVESAGLACPAIADPGDQSLSAHGRIS